MKEEPVLKRLIVELRESPDLALEYLSVMDKIAKPWEQADNSLDTGNFNAGILQFEKVSATGKVIATISKNFPTWNISILGERPKDAPPVFNNKSAEKDSKAFVDNKLAEMGFILMPEDEE